MRKLLPVFLCLLLLFSCGKAIVKENVSTTDVTEENVQSSSDTVWEEPQETPPETECVTEPLHSALYIPDLPVEDVIKYFNEVCLDTEISYSGDASLVQKWVSPIKCSVSGKLTDKDQAVLNGFFDFINSIEGFPGISFDEDGENLEIHFCTKEEMRLLMGDELAENDGAVRFWYNSANEVYDEIICYRTDLDQTVRNSVIIEEIYNGLGPIQDTALREDSIIYSGYSTPQQITEIDALILKLLYHPDIKCGMNASDCEIIIRQLYY